MTLESQLCPPSWANMKHRHTGYPMTPKHVTTHGYVFGKRNQIYSSQIKILKMITIIIHTKYKRSLNPLTLSQLNECLKIFVFKRYS